MVAGCLCEGIVAAGDSLVGITFHPKAFRGSTASLVDAGFCRMPANSIGFTRHSNMDTTVHSRVDASQRASD
jgi:hypothetical protein